MRFSLPALLVLLLSSLTGCQTGGSSDGAADVWRRPEYFGGPKRSVAVAVLAYRKDNRIRLENAVVAALRQRGVAAKATYPVIETQEIVSNKAGAVAKAKSLGVEAVLAVRLVDQETLKIVELSPTNTGAGLPPWQNWFEFFTVSSAFATNPESARPGNTIGAQVTFFACPSGDLLWSATFTRKVDGSDAEARAFATALVSKLQTSALIP